MTAPWALELKDGFGETNPELASQIFRLVLARALAMSRRLKTQGTQPLLFLDEPGLYGLSLSNPRQVLALQELKLLVQALRKEGVLVGIHCCSNTDWKAVLSLPIHYLSIDTSLSLGSLLANQEDVIRFLHEGGKLSLGVIPTGRSGILRSIDLRSIREELILRLSSVLGGEPGLLSKTLEEALYTPACGLALQSVADAELITSTLAAFSAKFMKSAPLASQLNYLESQADGNIAGH